MFTIEHNMTVHIFSCSLSKPTMLHTKGMLTSIYTNFQLLVQVIRDGHCILVHEFCLSYQQEYIILEERILCTLVS